MNPVFKEKTFPAIREHLCFFYYELTDVGNMIYKEGEPVNRIGIVIDGIVEVQKRIKSNTGD